MTGIGSAELAKHVAGIQLTATKAIKAKCCDCQKNYVNGKNDCMAMSCPLYPWYPYGAKPRKVSEKKATLAKERFTKKVRTNETPKKTTKKEGKKGTK